MVCLGNDCVVLSANQYPAHAAGNNGKVSHNFSIFKKPTEGKLYNTAVALGGLPSLGFIGVSIWFMFDGTFKPSHLFALIVGVAGLLTVNMVISKDDEAEKSLEESAVEANE